MRSSLFIYILSFYYLQLVNAYVQPEQRPFSSLNDPWDLALLASSNISRHPAPKLTAVSEDDPYFDVESKILRIKPSKDYSIDKQELVYASRWQNSISHHQRHFYDLVKESSDMFNNTEATYTMYRMHLYGEYGIPHNKTLAWQYLQKFNKLSKGSNSSALFDTAIAHITGLVDEIAVNCAKGMIYLRKAAVLGSLEAKQALAYRFSTHLNAPKDISKAQILYGSLYHDIYRRLNATERLFYDGENNIYNINLPELYGGIFFRDISLSSVARQQLKSEYNLYAYNSEDSYYIAPDPLMDVCHKLRKATEYYLPTYTQRSEYTKALSILNEMFEKYDSKLSILSPGPRLCYAASLEMLGHMWLLGKGVDEPNIESAKKFLSRAIKISSELKDELTLAKDELTLAKYELTLAKYELGAIYEHVYGDFEKAMEHYYALEQPVDSERNIPVIRNKSVSILSFIYTSFVHTNPELKKALVLESHKETKYEAFITKNYAIALERDAALLAPGLRDAFMNILLGNDEVALWHYLRASEQGFLIARGSAAFLLYQPKLLFEEESQVSNARLKLALSYYKKHIGDGLTVAGDIYYKMGEYKKAAVLYITNTFSRQASWNLAYLYEHGLGLGRDYPLAIKHYEKALRQLPVISLLMKPFIWILMLKSWIQSGKWRVLFWWL